MKHIVRQHLRKAVIVTLKTGEGFSGVLYDADSEAIDLRNCKALDTNGSDRQPVPVDGHLVLLRADLAYLQFL